MVILMIQKTNYVLSPQNAIIVFDLHGVLFKYDYKSIIKHLFSYPNKLSFIFCILKPRLLWDAMKLQYHKSVAEQYIIGLPKKYPCLQPYVPLGIKVANSQVPNKEMIKLIKELKKSGYSINIFSNIGREIFNDLQRKFPDIFSNFTHFILPSQENGYLRKPFQAAFENLITRYQPKSKTIIFIDDKSKNIKIAQLNNIIGILFKCSCQVRKKLQELGIISSAK